MGYFEIGIYKPKTEMNTGTLWRSAYQMGAAGIFVIGARYKNQASNTYKTERQIPLRCYDTFEEFMNARPYGAQLIGIEMGGETLKSFKHPKQAIYILGSEDNGLSQNVIKECQKIISLEAITRPSYNVAIAGSIVMYHRCFGLSKSEETK